MPISASELNEIPGLRVKPDRGVCYVESPDAASFKVFFSQIRNVGSTPPPRDGGMVNEEAAIRLPAGELFFAVSYRGDLAGMLRVITEFAAHRGVRSARVEGERLLLSDGTGINLLDCDLFSN